MIAKHDAEFALSRAMRTGADFAELLHRLQLARFQLTPYPTW